MFNEEELIQTKVETKITAPNPNVKEDSELKVESTGTQEFKEEKRRETKHIQAKRLSACKRHGKKNHQNNRKIWCC